MPEYNPKFTYYREPALSYAVRFGHRDVVAFLLENGASTDIVNGQGDRLLHVAMKLGHMEVIQLLLEAGART